MAYPGRYNAPAVSEAVLLVDEVKGPKDILLQGKDYQLRSASELHRSYDPLQYPVMGEDGYYLTSLQRGTAQQFNAFRLMAFADDEVLMFFGQSASALNAETNRALAHVKDWGDRNKLRFAPSKTKAMVLTKKLKFDVPVIRMGNIEIALVDEIRLLGLTIDKRLTFTPKACKKAANIYKSIARAAKHSIELKAWRAYRTVSLHSALILARLLPLDIQVRKAAKLYEVKRGKELGDIYADQDLERPLDFHVLPHPSHTPEFGFESVENLDPSIMNQLAIVGPHIYTDGSRIEDKISAALTEWRDGMESGNSAYSLESFCTVFHAEIFALHRAIRRVKKGKD
ncbi:hypothetical protein EVAR_36463_1 [Eumeta japonica]|uniref:115 kDa protein in type-1 retrotransposable element R1DM n=1 Tax=Eumeta variegata TaxID=151549 RepID=A0A4C1WS89_EUMVA|nr:hypothetical protein EVAR_36463_1 [Eumeta japonica]